VTLYDNNAVFTRVGELALCLCSQIADPENGVPDVCFCGLVPGEQAIANYAGDCKDKCGMAWVRLISMYPMASIGIPDATPGNCGVGVGIDVEMGILRCISVGDEVGNLPSPGELLEATQLQIADAMVMRKAVYCCDAIPSKEAILATYTPNGPLGGLVGGTMIVSMGTE
jgi:hypothetical protein